MTMIQASRGHIATLDLLRLFAALMVVIFHYLFRGAAAGGHLSQGYPEAAPYALYGYLGVNLFFLISGFVIAWSAEGKSWQNFAIARFARLYPGFLACMTATFVVMVLSGSAMFPVSLGQYAANLLMFAPALGRPFMDGVYWSIILEVIFYGWVAAALFGGWFDRFKLELVAGWLLVSTTNEVFVQSGTLRLLFITEFAPLFAAGILVHHIHWRGRSADALILLLASFVFSCATMGVTQGWMQNHYGVAVPLPGLLAANTVIFGTLIAAVKFRGLVRPSALVLALGGVTYPLYLLHQNVGYIAIEALSPTEGRWTAAGIVVVGMFAVSFLVWRFIETPARKGIVRLLTPLAETAMGSRQEQKPHQTAA